MRKEAVSEGICEIGVLKVPVFTNFTRKRLCQSRFFYRTPLAADSLPTNIKKEFKYLNLFPMAFWHSVNYGFNKTNKFN